MERLIGPHGGYRTLKSFQIAQLIYDITVRFCNRYIPFRSRTHDQMVQSARSGVQNIVEGSQVSGTSKKMELKLTNVARSSLEELRTDYQDFLRQRGLLLWDRDHPFREELFRQRLKTADAFALWVKSKNPADAKAASEIAANGVLLLLKVACSLLDRQLKAQAEAFKREGGFTEKMYRMRKQSR